MNNKFADPVLYDFGGPGDFIPLPPIYNPDPVKMPWLPPNPGNGQEPTFRSYVYSGVVRGAYTELPLPGATVTLIRNNQVVGRKAADRNGQFSFDVPDFPVDYISISEVSHKEYTWPASEVQHVFDLEPEVKEMDPIVVHSGGKKNNTWLWLLGLAAVAKWQKWI